MANSRAASTDGQRTAPCHWASENSHLRSVAPPAAHADAGFSEEEQALFQQLRAVRKQLAEQDSVPPFVIFSDATLRDMAAQAPRTRAEMLNVNGVGQVKFAKYGEPFLAITRTGRASQPPRGAFADRLRIKSR